MIKITESDKGRSGTRHLNRNPDLRPDGDRRGLQGSTLNTKEITQESTGRNTTVLRPKLIWCYLAEAEKCQYRLTQWLDSFSPTSRQCHRVGPGQTPGGLLTGSEPVSDSGTAGTQNGVGKSAYRTVSPHLSFLCSAPKQGFLSRESD